MTSSIKRLDDQSSSARRGGREFPLWQNTGFFHRIGYPDHVRHRVENATVCCFLHGGSLIRIGPNEPTRITWSRSVKRHPQVEDIA